MTLVPQTLIPVKALESPYHNLPPNKKTRVQAFISTDDLLKLRSYFPRKGVADAVVSGLVKGFILHMEALKLQPIPQRFQRNEQIMLQLIEQYVPGTPRTRIKHHLDESGNPDVTLLPHPGVDEVI